MRLQGIGASGSVDIRCDFRTRVLQYPLFLCPFFVKTPKKERLFGRTHIPYNFHYKVFKYLQMRENQTILFWELKDNA